MDAFESFLDLSPWLMLLIIAVLGSIYTGVATATEAAGVGVLGSLVLSALQGSLSWATFKESLMGGTRLYCMIALILAGASFLTLAMGYIGLPRHLAEWIGSQNLAPVGLLAVLMVLSKPLTSKAAVRVEVPALRAPATGTFKMPDEVAVTANGVTVVVLPMASNDWPDWRLKLAPAPKVWVLLPVRVGPASAAGIWPIREDAAPRALAATNASLILEFTFFWGDSESR
jgi:hypothetical protein